MSAASEMEEERKQLVLYDSELATASRTAIEKITQFADTNRIPKSNNGQSKASESDGSYDQYISAIETFFGGTTFMDNVNVFKREVKSHAFGFPFLGLSVSFQSQFNGPWTYRFQIWYCVQPSLAPAPYTKACIFHYTTMNAYFYFRILNIYANCKDQTEFWVLTRFLFGFWTGSRNAADYINWKGGQYTKYKRFFYRQGEMNPVLLEEEVKKFQELEEQATKVSNVMSGSSDFDRKKLSILVRDTGIKFDNRQEIGEFVEEVQNVKELELDNVDYRPEPHVEVNSETGALTVPQNRIETQVLTATQGSVDIARVLSDLDKALKDV